jgi:hypothetical protein
MHADLKHVRHKTREWTVAAQRQYTMQSTNPIIAIATSTTATGRYSTNATLQVECHIDHALAGTR